MAEDEMVGWYHQLNGHEFEQTRGDGEGQEAWLALVHGISMSQLFISGGQNTGVSFAESVLPMNIQG